MSIGLDQCNRLIDSEVVPFPVDDIPEKRYIRESINQIQLRPFIRWAGGKRWLVTRYPKLILAPTNGVYFEPFLGSASVFASVNPQCAVLADLNSELITTYKAIRDNPESVWELLNQHQKLHTESYYYATRAIVPELSEFVAARFLYLNRTCFNGLYRVNRKGLFNVPIGSRQNICRQDDDFVSWSRVLSSCELLAVDFESVVQQAGHGDLIYTDPPYTVRHNLNAFRKYNESLFSWEDQMRLASALTAAVRRGAQVVVSNANHLSISELYPSCFYRKKIARNSSIAATSADRGAFDELLLWTEGAVDERVFS